MLPDRPFTRRGIRLPNGTVFYPKDPNANAETLRALCGIVRLTGPLDLDALTDTFFDHEDCTDATE